MKKYLYSACVLGLYATMVAAEEVGPSPKAILKDSSSVTHVTQVMIPTLAFKKDMTLPEGYANEDGPMLFQNGKEISLKDVDKTKTYCTIGGNYSDFNSPEGSKSHTIKAGQRLKLGGPLSHRNVSAEFNFDESKMKITGIKSKKADVKIEFVLHGGSLVQDINDAYLEGGLLSRTAFPVRFEESSFFSGNLKCFNFSEMPTIGDVKKIIGTEKVAIMPDETEPMEFELGTTKFTDYDPNDDKNFDFLIKQMNSQIEVALKNLDPNKFDETLRNAGINISDNGKDSSFEFDAQKFEKAFKELSNSASRQ